jgi:D-tyrosyl-tRNA(Tyr) deacylase
MRAVLQRVTNARVTVDDRLVSGIGAGLLVFLGIERGDTGEDVRYLAGKIGDLRIFEDDDGRMNRSARETGAEVLLVSQFTLAADCRRGRRPSFAAAAPPDEARPIYEAFAEALRRLELPVQTGEFRAMMRITLTNDGPVTILLDSRQRQDRP